LNLSLNKNISNEKIISKSTHNIAMILDHIQHSSEYESLHPLFPEAFANLRRLANTPDLPDGRLDIDGDRLFALVMEGQGKSKASSRIEAHRRYIDIQYTSEGSELIGWIPLADCHHALGYDESKDVEFFDDVIRQWIAVPAGHFAVFLPHDAHAPMANDGEPVKKIVIKVAMNSSTLS